jgi:hypothetical protein
MFDYTKIDLSKVPTATDAVEQARRFFTATLTFHPVEQIRDAIAKGADVTLSAATVYAEHFDKTVATYFTGFGIPTKYAQATASSTTPSAKAAKAL